MFSHDMLNALRNAQQAIHGEITRTSPVDNDWDAGYTAGLRRAARWVQGLKDMAALQAGLDNG